jgi:hypothetical protein
MRNIDFVSIAMDKRQITPGYWYHKTHRVTEPCGYGSDGKFVGPTYEATGWTIVRVEVSLDTQLGLEKNGFEAYYIGEECPVPLEEGWDDDLIGPVLDPAHFYL